MDSEDLLAQLADIHLPAPVSYWPPAPGWWLLGLVLLVLAVLLIRRYQHALYLRRICQHAVAELDRVYNVYAHSDGDPDEARLRYVNEFNSVLRRVALYHFPQSNVASLSGQAWVDFVRQKGDAGLLDEEIANALSYGRFQTKCEVDVEAMNTLGHAWVTSLYRRSAEPQSAPQGLTH